MLRVRSSNKHQTIDKQQIINYEYKMTELSLPLVEPVICNTSKYAPWELDTKIKETIGSIPHTVRWVGSSQTAYLETYAYIMLMGTGQSQANILEFKKCLQLAQQKLLVEFLCLIEYSRDKYSFLNKYPQIQAIFIKILQYLEEENTNSDDSAPEQSRKAKIRRKLKAHSGDGNSPNSQSLSQQLEYERELQQIYRTFNNYFQFISLLSSNQLSCTFKLFDFKRIHLIIEKDCYFMVEPVEQDHPQYTFGMKPPKSDRRGSQQPSFLVDSSNENFDKKQFLDIFNYKGEVQESNVRPVQHGSQIRKPPNSYQAKLGHTTPKFHQTVPQAFPCPQEFEIQKIQEKLQHDRTFIDELLNNVVMKSEEQHKKHKQDKMKGILMIKEELKKVQMRIQDKIKQFDLNKAYQKPSDLHIREYINPNSDKIETSKEEPQSKQFKTNLVKQSVVKRHEASTFIKKQRKVSYNSVKNIPYCHHSNRNQQNAELESPNPSSPKNHGSSNPLHRVDRMLSQKAVSRPDSNLKPLLQQDKKYQRSRSPEPLIRYQYKMRSFSPKNLNVNVNVNINENLISAIPYKDSSFPMPFKQLYPKKTNKQGHFSSQYYVPSQIKKQYDAQSKVPHFLERVKSKVSNAKASFIKSGNINLLLNNK